MGLRWQMRKRRLERYYQARAREREERIFYTDIRDIRNSNDQWLFFLVASFPLSAEVVKRSNVYVTECRWLFIRVLLSLSLSLYLIHRTEIDLDRLMTRVYLTRLPCLVDNISPLTFAVSRSDAFSFFFFFFFFPFTLTTTSDHTLIRWYSCSSCHC